jgi:hypothetical protein
MIFVDPTTEASDEVFSLGVYYPVKDPRFSSDGHSKAILKIKYRHGEEPDSQPWKQGNKTIALANFYRRLDGLLAPGIAIAVVPSHKTFLNPSGIQELAQRLAANQRIDATGCLIRRKAIPKLAKGGNRSVVRHLETIEVQHAELITGRDVLLLDDVTTSGGSLDACRQLLLGAGALAVKRAVLGTTVRY